MPMARANATALSAKAERLSGGGLTAVPLTAAGVALVAVTAPRLLPRGTLRAARGLPSVVGVRGLYTAAYFGTEAFVPLMLVTERGFTPAQAGLALTGGVLGWFSGSTLQTRQMAAPRWVLLVAGGGVLAAGLGALVLVVATGASGWWVLLVWVLAGCGMGLGVSTTSVLTLGLTAPAERGVATSSLQLSDNLGAVLGIAAAGAVFAAGHTGGGHDDALFAGLFAGLAGVAVLAAVVGLRAHGAQPVADAGDADVPARPRPDPSATVQGP